MWDKHERPRECLYDGIELEVQVMIYLTEFFSSESFNAKEINRKF